jgi:hypothetical protein
MPVFGCDVANPLEKSHCVTFAMNMAILAMDGGAVRTKGAQNETLLTL